ncbi:MAG TPA: hypothetical protein DIW46_00795 [Microbacterium sp.]|nr:hypothetical protein [Microbacterium sp.]
MTGDALAMGMMANNLDPGSMMPVRVGLKREAGRQAARRGDHINLARMAVALDTMHQSVDDHGFREADRVFHDALVAASGVPGLQFFGEILRNILTATVREVPLDERDHLHGLHVEIYEAVRDGDPDRAMQAVDGHFDWLDNAIERGRSTAKGEGGAFVNGWPVHDRTFFQPDRGETLAKVTGYWNTLADGAAVIEPLAASAWSPGFGMLTDRFGVTWVLDVQVEYAD